MDFQKYLDNAIDKGIHELRLVVSKHKDGTPKFYIHPLNKDGDTADFLVRDQMTFDITGKSY